MSLIGISEFQNATGLSDAAMFRLIKDSPASLRLDPQHGLLVESDSIDIQAIIKAIADVKLESEESLVSAIEQRVLEFFHDLMAERRKDAEDGPEQAPQKKGGRK